MTNAIFTVDHHQTTISIISRKVSKTVITKVANLILQSHLIAYVRRFIQQRHNVREVNGNENNDGNENKNDGN